VNEVSTLCIHILTKLLLVDFQSVKSTIVLPFYTYYVIYVYILIRILPSVTACDLLLHKNVYFIIIYLY
jgi:hypothetical protein